MNKLTIFRGGLRFRGRALDTERIVNYCLKKKRTVWNALFARWRVRRLLRTDFTIISNNCWGGHVYQHFGLPYRTPTVGLYFYADDYLRFVADLPHCLAQPIEIISATQSAHYADLCRKHQEHNPVGRIDSKDGAVEVQFLHYHTADEAQAVWERRRKRVNTDNMIVKFSMQNGATPAHLAQFLALPYPTKLAFVADKALDTAPETVFFPGSDHDDTTRYCHYLDLVKFINIGKAVEA